MLYRVLLAFAISLTLLVPAGYATPASGAGPSGAGDWYVSSGDKVSVQDVLKSPADDRDYRYLTLDNGMGVLLISDPGTDKAAASLSVDIGSFQNPADRQGLAHFLEHMLFLGTDKYPEPGEYQAYLSEHGGSFNAYTSLEETNYFFDIDSDYLVPTLDRFSRFFVAPLFNPEYVDRERHAVDSEYQLKIKDDSRREWDVLSEVVNPEHPFAMFSVGSLDTLENPPGRPVRDDLLRFYEHYYSASRINLVVLGGESLDELQHIVSERFSAVPSHRVELKAQDIPLFKGSLPLKVYIKPVKELRQLSFNFPVATIADLWREKPLQYLGHLLGHEGEGSLVAALKEKGLAEGLQAGLVYDSRYGGLFSVQIDLTPAGVEKESQVTGAFFAWLDLVKEQGVDKWRYEEVARLGEIGFRFAEEQPPMNYVQQLSGALHKIDAGDVLRGSYWFGRYSPELIRRYAGYLSADNVLVELIAPGVETDRVSKLYSAPYRVEELTVADLAAGDKAPMVGDLSLPQANPYVPDALVVNEPAKKIAKPYRVGAKPGFWYYPDGEFLSPKGYFQARVALDDMTSLERRVLLDYLLAVVNDQLNTEAYPAMLAGMDFNIAPWERGFAITLAGFDQKQGVLLTKIVDALVNPDWQPGRLERVKTTLVRRWRNTASDWPLRQLFARLPSLITQEWLPTAKADVLESISAEQLRAFHRDLLTVAGGRFYAGGNYSRKQAEHLVGLVNRGLGLKGKVDASVQIGNLERAESLPVSRYFADHDDSAAVLYLQGDEDSLRERATVAFLNNIIQAPFYSTLRTEKQLGYAVGTSIFPMERVPGALYFAQSPKVNADELRAEIDNFLVSFRDRVEQLSDDDIERYRVSVLAQITEKPRNLNQLASRHLESLDLGFDAFDFRGRLAAEVASLSRKDIVGAYDRLVIGRRAGLWVLTTDDEATDNSAELGQQAFEGMFRYPQ